METNTPANLLLENLSEWTTEGKSQLVKQMFPQWDSFDEINEFAITGPTTEIW